MRKNPFQPVYDACNLRDPQDKVENLPAWPTHVDLELTNNCNFRCLMCAQRVPLRNKAKGFMAEPVFERLVSELKGPAIPVRVIGWGEPTLHPKWLKFVDQAKQAGLMVHFCTNGGLIDRAQMRALADMGLESMKFSFQGVDRKSFREMRNRDYFDQLRAKVRAFSELRGDRPLPFLHISTTITYESADQVRAFRREMSEYADLVTVGRTFFDTVDPDQGDFTDSEKELLARLMPKESVVKRHPKFCPEVFDKLTVNWDGTVSACCRDFDNLMLAGDLRTQSLQECWVSERMEGYRRLLAQRKYQALALCRTCYDYMGLSLPGLQET
ncbi:MAG: radical SAM/SPASM domain-containing protein [Desulfovibrionaceae bacterium]|nr:radical SAM/SPASM domain-containing protein [Desulfovibrionaceae bacterium]